MFKNIKPSRYFIILNIGVAKYSLGIWDIKFILFVDFGVIYVQVVYKQISYLRFYDGRGDMPAAPEKIT